MTGLALILACTLLRVLDRPTPPLSAWQAVSRRLIVCYLCYFRLDFFPAALGPGLPDLLLCSYVIAAGARFVQTVVHDTVVVFLFAVVVREFRWLCAPGHPLQLRSCHFHDSY